MRGNIVGQEGCSLVVKSTDDAARNDLGARERQRFVRAHVSTEMEGYLAGQPPRRSSPSTLASWEGATMHGDHVDATGPGRAGEPIPVESADAHAGIQRLLDAWTQATLAERNTFLWLAAEEIQAAQEGEFQNALSTPQAPGNGPSFRAQEDTPASERAPGGLSSADLAAAEEEASAWLDEEAEQARLWRDDAAAAQSQGIPMPWRQMKESFEARPSRGEDPT
jgi:hypothetical protein